MMFFKGYILEKSFIYFFFLIGQIQSQSIQATFDLPKENHFCTNSGIIQLPQGYPVGGIYSGLGVSENTFDTNLFPGTYEIKYTIIDAGVLFTASDTLSLMNCESLPNTQNLNNINLFPNGTINLWVLENALGLYYEVVTSLGLIIHTEKLVSVKQVIDLHNAPRNIYCVRVKDKNGAILKLKYISLD